MLKSFACFVTGIALIAIVVLVAPIQYAMAQTATTKHQFYCDTTDPHVPEFPDVVFCDQNKADCNENTKIYFQSVQKCVNGGAECLNSCTEWMGPATYRTFPIVFKTTSQWKRVGKVAGGGAVAIVCYVGDAKFLDSSNVPKWIKKLKILKNVNVTGLVLAVVCSQVGDAATEAAIDAIFNACDFGDCKVDWTKETVGPDRKHCCGNF